MKPLNGRMKDNSQGGAPRPIPCGSLTKKNVRAMDASAMKLAEREFFAPFSGRSACSCRFHTWLMQLSASDKKGKK